MAQTWYDDDGKVPREEWGGMPQVTKEDIESAKEAAERQAKYESRIKEEQYEQRKAEVLNRAYTYEDQRAAIEREQAREHENKLQQFEQELQQHEQEQKLREERKQHHEAVVAARKRYEEKNSFYRLFHRSLSVKKASNMTTEEINGLYGGIEEGKGKSR